MLLVVSKVFMKQSLIINWHKLAECKVLTRALKCSSGAKGHRVDKSASTSELNSTQSLDSPLMASL